MSRTRDYTKELPEEIQTKIKDLYTLGKTWVQITKETGVSYDITKKFLMQAGVYVFRNTKTHVQREIELQRKNPEIEEVIYGSDVMYKWHELSYDEMVLIKDKNHNKLKQGYESK